MKVIMTGGGTGGHIYPAIAIADKDQRTLSGKPNFVCRDKAWTGEKDRTGKRISH